MIWVRFIQPYLLWNAGDRQLYDRNGAVELEAAGIAVLEEQASGDQEPPRRERAKAGR